MKYILLILLVFSTPAWADLSQYSTAQLMAEVARRIDSRPQADPNSVLVKFFADGARDCSGQPTATLAISLDEEASAGLQRCMRLADIHGNRYIRYVDRGGGCGERYQSFTNWCHSLFPE